MGAGVEGRPPASADLGRHFQCTSPAWGRGLFVGRGSVLAASCTSGYRVLVARRSVVAGSCQEQDSQIMFSKSFLLNS